MYFSKFKNILVDFNSLWTNLIKRLKIKIMCLFKYLYMQKIRTNKIKIFRWIVFAHVAYQFKSSFFNIVRLIWKEKLFAKTKIKITLACGEFLYV